MKHFLNNKFFVVFFLIIVFFTSTGFTIKKDFRDLYIKALQNNSASIEKIKKDIGKQSLDNIDKTRHIDILFTVYNRFYPESFQEIIELSKKNKLWDDLGIFLRGYCTGQLFHNIPFNAKWCVEHTKEAMNNGSFTAYDLWWQLNWDGLKWDDVHLRANQNITDKILKNKFDTAVKRHLSGDKRGTLEYIDYYQQFISSSWNHRAYFLDGKDLDDYKEHEKRKIYKDYLQLIKYAYKKNYLHALYAAKQLYEFGCGIKPETGEATIHWHTHFTIPKEICEEEDFKKNKIKADSIKKTIVKVEKVEEWWEIAELKTFEEAYYYGSLSITKDIFFMYLGSDFFEKYKSWLYKDIADKEKYIDFINSKVPKNNDELLKLIELGASTNDLEPLSYRGDQLTFSAILFWIYNGQDLNRYDNYRRFYQPPFHLGEQDIEEKIKKIIPDLKQEKDFSKALKRYINAGPLFYKHNPNIGFFVGRMYQNRLLDADTDKSRLKAFDIYYHLAKIGIEQTNKDCYGWTKVSKVAKYLIGEMYLKKKVMTDETKSNIEEALPYFHDIHFSGTRGGDEGTNDVIVENLFFAQSAYIIGNETLKRKNYLEASKWFARAADYGHTLALYKLAKLILDDYTPFVQNDISKEWDNNMIAYFLLAHAYSHSKKTNRNYYGIEYEEFQNILNLKQEIKKKITKTQLDSMQPIIDKTVKNYLNFGLRKLGRRDDSIYEIGLEKTMYFVLKNIGKFSQPKKYCQFENQ